MPEGNKFLLQTFARGVQIYEVRRSATDPNVFSWVNIVLLATFYANPNFTNEVIHHFAGPTWEFIKGPAKGERVVATKLQRITQDVTAIQWLLLKAGDSLSTANNKITFIQRICTAGGLAPTTGADEAHLGQLDNIPIPLRTFSIQRTLKKAILNRFQFFSPFVHKNGEKITVTCSPVVNLSSLSDKNKR